MEGGGGTNEEGVATVKERGGVGGSGSDREGKYPT